MKLRFACLGMLLLWGCSRASTESTEEVVLDLVGQLDEAQVTGETGRLDIGTPQARSFLTGDWSWNEKDGIGTTFVWGGPGHSKVAFFTVDARPQTIKLRCLPYREVDGHVDAMSVRLNDSRVGAIDLQEGWTEYALDLDTEQVLPGVNRLEFEYRWSTDVPLPAEDHRGRKVAVAWDWIEFSGPESGTPAADPASGLLKLTPGSRTDFFFETPADAELVVDTIAQKGEGAGTLVITSLQDGAVPQRLLEFDGWHRGRPLQGRRQQHRSLPLKEPPNRWSLAATGGLVRLRLDSTGAFELSGPRVVTATRQTRAEPTSSSPPRPEPQGEPPLVLLYVIDAFRADHLGSFSVTDERTPGLAAMAQDAVVFEKTIAQSSWTKPAVASILTGQLPWGHGARDAKDRLSADLETLPARMQQSGFRTAAFSANGFVSGMFGFDHGFDHFVLTPDYDTPSSQLHSEAMEWLTGQTDGQVFLYIHSIDPHAPYDPDEPFRSQFLPEPIVSDIGSVASIEAMAQSRRKPEVGELAAIKSLYSAEIAFTDQQLSTLIENLKVLDLYDASLIVVMSDHGEEFYEHGSWTHGRTLHPEVLNVPLLIKFPHSWGAGVRITEPVQQIDLLPTLEDFLGMAPTAALPGHSLLCAVQQAVSGSNLDCETGRARPIFSSLDYYNNHWVAVMLGDWKLILPGVERLAGDARLYAHRTDRAELDNVARDFPVQVGYLTALIRSEMRSRSTPFAPEQVELDPETEARLKALGYLD